MTRMSPELWKQIPPDAQVIFLEMAETIKRLERRVDELERRLYDFRCEEVHRIGSVRRKFGPYDVPSMALDLFVRCLQKIVAMISEHDIRNEKAMEKALERLASELVLPPP